MSTDNRTVGGIDVTPALVAELFWGLDADEQATFFAELHRMAGWRIHIQMLAALNACADLSSAGDYDAMMGFRAFADDANEYPALAAHHRALHASIAIDRMAEKAKGLT